MNTRSLTNTNIVGVFWISPDKINSHLAVNSVLFFWFCLLDVSIYVNCDTLACSVVEVVRFDLDIEG